MDIFAIFGVFIAIGIVAEIFKNKNLKSSKLLTTFDRTTKVLPHALTMLIMVSHASEFTRVVSHVKPIHIAISAVVFGLWIFGVKNANEEI